MFKLVHVIKFHKYDLNSIVSNDIRLVREINLLELPPLFNVLTIPPSRHFAQNVGLLGKIFPEVSIITFS